MHIFKSLFGIKLPIFFFLLFFAVNVVYAASQGDSQLVRSDSPNPRTPVSFRSPALAGGGAESSSSPSVTGRSVSPVRQRPGSADMFLSLNSSSFFETPAPAGGGAASRSPQSVTGRSVSPGGISTSSKKISSLKFGRYSNGRLSESIASSQNISPYLVQKCTVDFGQGRHITYTIKNACRSGALNVLSFGDGIENIFNDLKNKKDGCFGAIEQSPSQVQSGGAARSRMRSTGSRDIVVPVPKNKNAIVPAGEIKPTVIPLDFAPDIKDRFAKQECFKKIQYRRDQTREDTNADVVDHAITPALLGAVFQCGRVFLQYNSLEEDLSRQFTIFIRADLESSVLSTNLGDLRTEAVAAHGATSRETFEDRAHRAPRKVITLCLNFARDSLGEHYTITRLYHFCAQKNESPYGTIIPLSSLRLIHNTQKNCLEFVVLQQEVNEKQALFEGLKQQMEEEAGGTDCVAAARDRNFRKEYNDLCAGYVIKEVLYQYGQNFEPKEIEGREGLVKAEAEHRKGIETMKFDELHAQHTSRRLDFGAAALNAVWAESQDNDVASSQQQDETTEQ